MLVVGTVTFVGNSVIPRHPRTGIAIMADKCPSPSVFAAVGIGTVKDVPVKEGDIARLQNHGHPFISAGNLA